MGYRKQTKASANWTPLADGVALFMREADGADEGLAEQKAKAAIRAMKKADETAEDYGFDYHDFASFFGEEDANVFAGFGQILFAVELAMIVASDIRGFYLDANPEPEAFSRRTLWHLFTGAVPEPVPVHGLQVRRFSTLFLSKALRAQVLGTTEGNVSGAAPATGGMAAPMNADPAP